MTADHTTVQSTTAITKEYFEKIVLPRVDGPTEVLIDSWTGFTKAINTEEIEEEEDLRFHIIPSNQPLEWDEAW